jgi:hypothetical protein
MQLGFVSGFYVKPKRSLLRYRVFIMETEHVEA